MHAMSSENQSRNQRTDRGAFAGHERSPEREAGAEVELAERQTHLADGIVATEAIVVEYE